MFDLTGRTALVTGSSRGIGRAIAQALSEAGARVAVHGRTRSEALAQSAEQFGEVTLVGDLAEAEAPARLVEEAVGRLGGLSILVNNAGMVTPAKVDCVRREVWDQTIAVNLRSAFFAAQTAARHMRGTGFGRIVNISSQAAEAAIEGYLPYGVSKGGLNTMTKYLASEFAVDAITVNCVAPAFVRTELADEVFRSLPDLYESQLARVPLRRMCEPREVAAAVAFLCSEEAGFITGEVLHIDGGYLTE